MKIMDACVEFRCAVVFAVWTAASSVFVVGAAGESPRSFVFAVYVSGTILGLLLTLIFIARGIHGR